MAAASQIHVQGPQYHGATTVQARKRQLILQLPNESPHHKTRPRTETADFRKFCQDLGFQEKFPDDILFMPEEVRGHQTREEWILQLMQEKYEERLSENDSMTSLTFDSLAALGFSYDKIQAILGRIPQRLRPYEETIYWAQQIVSDDLFHMQNECPIYPFNDASSYKVTSWPNQHEKTEVSTQDLTFVNMPGFSRGSRSVGNSIKNLTGFPKAGPGELMLYHATSHDSVAHILKYGVDLEKGKKPSDFSNGYSFYLDPDVDSCYDFAGRIKSAKAVLVFKVTEEDFTSTDNTLNLCDAKHKGLWQEVVKRHRQPAGVPKAVKKLQEEFGLSKPYRNYDVVFGPWCKNIDEVMRPKMPQLPKPNEHQVQYMVQSQELADKLNQSLKCVLFFPKSKK
ncbi:PREDICTED: uncharacterized protein LOC109476534 [Branchiostoma belcheri]|uniref:Uncharacterized protein LOC109476534 n=1 Tax=Branchiostoma belcheri TaxID=7741 RepID=A0A6P4ZU03_BRABE|nr:PREDICTED: uncharacterized protein LOC109476534 [Branchiostoma belcheri]XP_019633077.1 PREDICTED: uncharacterized protein LOC109476534 [Branchiostoma belcheri]